MANIQRARAEDVDGIAEVIRNVWKLEIDVPYVQKLINSKKQLSWVAIDEGKVCGFVSSFLTTVQGGVRRWEVDLLAVEPAAQGQGLGPKLVEATTQDGKAFNVKFSRALVRANNTYAHKVFERSGFTNTGQFYNMYLWQPAESDAQAPTRAVTSLIPVDTLTYRGVWIEGLDAEFTSEADCKLMVAAARAMAFRDGRDNASTLIPAGKNLPESVMQDASFQGQYQWWRRV